MAQVSQEEMDRRIAAFGGSALTHSPTVSKRKVPNPEHGANGGTKWMVPREIDIEVQRWKGPGANGAEIEAYQLPDGSWEIVKEQPAAPTTTSAGTRPQIPPGGSSETEGTPIKDAQGNITGWDNNRPRQVIKDRNGNVVWSEELTGADLTAWRNAQQANQPQTGEVRKPVEGRPSWTSITRKSVQGGNTTETTVYVGPDGKEVPTLPEQPKDPTVQIVTINGQRYQVRTTPGRSGEPPKVEWFDPSGKPIAQPPADIKPGQVIKGGGPRGEDVQAVADPTTGAISYQPIKGATPNLDNPTVPGPPIPNYVVGASQEALRNYKQQLQQGVATGQWSQKWADDRWGEALQLARVVNEDYATQESRRQSLVNADWNAISTRATLGQNAITSALSHVNQINGYLPEDSPLGGQGFAALLGISMLMQARSGLDSFDPTGQKYQPPAIAPASFANPQALQDVRAQVAAQVAEQTARAQAPQPTSASSEPVFRPQAPVDLKSSAAMPAATASSAPRPAAAQVTPASPAPVLPTNRPDQIQAAPQIEDAINPPATPPPGTAENPLPRTPGYSGPDFAPANMDPSQGPVGMAPLPPILAQYSQQPAAPMQQPAPEQPQPTPIMSPAMLASRARSVPPWQLSPEEIEQMQAAGVPDSDIWAIPGRVA